MAGVALGLGVFTAVVAGVIADRRGPEVIFVEAAPDSETPTTSTTLSPIREAMTRRCVQKVEPVADDPGTTVNLALEEVVFLEPLSELVFATAVVAIGADDYLVGRRDGAIFGVIDGVLGDDPILTLDTSVEGDQGLLEMVIDPSQEWLYVLRTDTSGATVLSAHALGDGPVVGPAKTIVEVEQPTAAHNGGGLGFAADGSLFVVLGDGGGEVGDPDLADAREPDLLLGKVLRIWPDPDPDSASVYRVPADNPFVDDPLIADEIFASGVRNGFRLTVDLPTGDIWVADTGQNCWDEVTRIAPGDAGADLGWDAWEGAQRFRMDRDPGDHLPPIYDWLNGCAAIGGFVYRGTAIPELDGAYLLADWCSGWFRAVWADDRGVLRTESLSDEVERPIAIVADQDGEPLLLSSDGPLYRLVPG